MNLVNLKKNDFNKTVSAKNHTVYLKKILFLASIFFAAGLVVMIKITEISVINHQNVSVKKDKILNDNKERGIIFDRNKRVLAGNIFLYQLKVYPKLIINSNSTANTLINEFPDLDKNKLIKRLNDKSKTEIVIKKNITPPKAKKINDLGIPGVEFSMIKKRFYPNQNLASHLVGHINNNQLGVYGAERAFNDKLSKGKDVYLSIDNRIQYVVRKELKKGFDEFRAKSATAIIANLETFEILSLVSLPDFNPNQSIDPKKNSYRNTATLNVYEMGSTFKVFTIAAALEYSKLKLTSPFDASHPLKISSYMIKDYHPENRVLTTKEVFIKSSNIGSSLIALQLGSKNLKQFYSDLGILNYSQIELFEKSRPLLPQKWGQIETATISYGHGISVTPIHMLEAASLVFGEKGYSNLSILRQNISKKEINKNIISNSTRKKLIQLMEDNINVGTAKKAKVSGYKIGGKTATGEKINIYGRYDKKRLVSSFLAIFPTDKPKYISLVLFDEPYLIEENKKTKYGATGGKTAAPVTANIITNIVQFLDITKDIQKDNQLIVKNRDKFNFASY